MKQHMTYTVELSDDFVGNIARINNALERSPQSLEAHREDLTRPEREMENAKEEMEKPFPQEQELAKKSARLTELNTALDREEKDGAKDANEEREDKQEAWADPGTRPSILRTLKEYKPPLC